MILYILDQGREGFSYIMFNMSVIAFTQREIVTAKAICHAGENGSPSQDSLFAP